MLWRWQGELCSGRESDSVLFPLPPFFADRKGCGQGGRWHRQLQISRRRSLTCGAPSRNTGIELQSQLSMVEYPLPTVGFTLMSL